MDVKVRCTHCDARLVIDEDDLGERIKCDDCGDVFTARESSRESKRDSKRESKRESDRESDRESRRRTAERRPKQRSRSGLGLIIGIIIGLALPVGMCLLCGIGGSLLGSKATLSNARWTNGANFSVDFRMAGDSRGNNRGFGPGGIGPGGFGPGGFGPNRLFGTRYTLVAEKTDGTFITSEFNLSDGDFGSLEVIVSGDRPTGRLKIWLEEGRPPGPFNNSGHRVSNVLTLN
jgi:predicted Zn finger-like uncharacterized protein